MVWINMYQVYFSPRPYASTLPKRCLGSCNDGPAAPQTTMTRQYQITQWYQSPKLNLSKKQIGAFHKMLSYSFNTQLSAGWTYVSLPLQSSLDARIKPAG